MKIRNLVIIALISIICLSVCGCASDTQTVASPSLDIDWNTIINGISEDELSAVGLYADMDSLESDAEEFGVVSFCNYDPNAADSFKSVDYQLCIEYGLGYTYENGSANYFDYPVYSILLVDNRSDGYYSCICDENSEILSEEGSWFLSEDKDSYIASCIENCSDVLFGN